MKKAELIVACLAIVSIILDQLLISGGATLLLLSFFTLASIYFGFSFALFNDIRLRKVFDSDSYKDVNKWRIIGAAGVGFGLSTTLIGVMFKLMSWTGPEFNLVIGLS